MNRVELTPIQKINPRVSDHVVKIVEKCLAVQPKDRYQAADELRYELMEARSISRRKVPLELVLQPPPITLHDQLPGQVGSFSRKDGAKKPLGAGKNKKISTRPLDSDVPDLELFPLKPKNQRRSPGWLFFVVLPLLVLSGFVTYAVRPDLVNQVIAYVVPGIDPTFTPTFLISTNTQIPIIGILSLTPTSTVPPTPTNTITPSPTFIPTLSPSPTITETPFPTPLGGAGQIAFASNRSGAVEIWLMNIDGTQQKQITYIPEGACEPRWSPDGMRIVFISPCIRHLSSYPGANLYIINADGTGMIPLPNVPGGDYDPSWSPDGNLIAFTSLRKEGVPGIFILNLLDYTVKSLVEDETRAISQPAWSPNGKEIAYVNSDNRIWVMDGEW